MRTLFVFLILLVQSVSLGLVVRQQYHAGDFAFAGSPPDVVSDLKGKVVVLPDQVKPGQIVGWYFSPEDKLMAEIIDKKIADNGPVYYVKVTAMTKGNLMLSGILQMGYTKVDGKYFLVSLGNVNLVSTPVTDTPKVEVPKPAEPEVKPKADAPTKSTINKAQPTPGNK